MECTAKGNPVPTVDWLAADGGSVASISGIRHVLENGTIYFPPFEAEAFRQDVHWAIYKCAAVNSVGAIISRDVTVRAGKRIGYNSESHPCHIPSLIIFFVILINGKFLRYWI